jgi:hypothetical protein
MDGQCVARELLENTKLVEALFYLVTLLAWIINNLKFIVTMIILIMIMIAAFMLAIIFMLYQIRKIVIEIREGVHQLLLEHSLVVFEGQKTARVRRRRLHLCLRA